MNLQDYSVLIIYNQPRSAVGAHASISCVESDAGVLAEVEAVAAALEKLGVRHRAEGLRTLQELPELLLRAPEPLVFNLVEGFLSNGEDANLVPAICLAHGKGCTGNPTHALTLGLDKWSSKGVLRSAGVAVPAGVVVYPGDPVPVRGVPKGKLIVKPVATDASEGIDEENVMLGEERERLEGLVRRLHERFNQPVLIEPYVGSRELNVSVVELDGEVKVLAIAEIDFSAFAEGKPKIVSYAAKWLEHTFEYQNTPRILPAPIPEDVAKKARKAALRAWKAVGGLDYMRVDFRLDEENEPVAIEVNPNPDISPWGGFAAALEWAGVSYEQFVAKMLGNALGRLHARSIPAGAGAQANAGAAAPPPGMVIRRTEQRDRDAIVKLVADTKFFREDEVTVAAEVLDEALAKGPEDHYQTFTAEMDGRPVGWVCHGPTPCTIGTYDIYWLAVSPETQGHGVGRHLMRFAEEHIRSLGGRLSVVETAGRAIYDSTRAFYQRIGYTEASRLPEFYAKNDDKIIYLKKL
jgi:D-alanine-D-alanine ligase